MSNISKRISQKVLGLIQELKFVVTNGLTYVGIRKYLWVNGFLTENEAVELFRITQKIKSINPVAVEIGSWQGKSALCIAKGLKKKFSKPKLYCIDPFDASGHPLYAQIVGDNNVLKSIFIRNMERNETLSIITILQGFSQDFSKGFAEKIDLLFIDGNHDYEFVLRDFEEWSPYVKQDGFIAFHDVEFDPNDSPNGSETFLGPGLVIKNKIIGNPDWVDYKRKDGLFYARKAR
jgi:predicted O-methyltransferase YrrM